MKLAAELEASLREFASAGAAELCENGGRLAPLSKLSWEVRGSDDKPLLHIWSEQYNLTRRVIAITDHSFRRPAGSGRGTLRAFSSGSPGVCAHRVRAVRAGIVAREFCERLKKLLACQFPDETVESATISADLEHSLSGNYVRGLSKRGSRYEAFLAVPDGESQDTINSSLTFALLWLDRLRNSNHRGTVEGVRLIVPKNACSVVAHRFAALAPGLAIELYERDAARESLERIDPCRESEALLAQARTQIEPIVASDPKAIAVHPCTTSREVVLRYRGLAFARWDDGAIFFGCGDMREELTPASRGAFERMMQDLAVYRHPLASDTRHPLYRAQAERWLESLVRNDVTRVDGILDSRFVYAQVFAGSGAEHGIIDVLTITRAGRLAILELKASEHIHLSLQAADYWLRVRRHLELGEFRSYGYFPGVEIQGAPPLVYLVAPALRFHPVTGILLDVLSPQIEVVRVGLTENWRRGIRVVMRQ